MLPSFVSKFFSTCSFLNSTALSTYLGICYSSTPLPGTKIYTSFLGYCNNDHKPGGLKQQKFILSWSGSQTFEIKVPALPQSLRRLLERILPQLFQLLVALGILACGLPNSAPCLWLLSLSSLLFLRSTLAIGCRVHRLILDDLILRSLT